MERDAKMVEQNEVVASQIPTRSRMYNIIDESEEVKSTVFLTPTGEMKTLGEMREQEHIDLDDMRPHYPVDQIELVFPQFELSYDGSGSNHYDRWQWTFTFTADLSEEEMRHHVNRILNMAR